MNSNGVVKSVSIVVCAYNEELHVLNCLNSISESVRLTGRESEFEILCVDNSSTDGTGDIVRDYCANHPCFRYFKIRHCSLSISRNIALTDACGEYISYVDADGYVHEQWATELLSVLEEKKPDILSGPVREADSSCQNLLYELHFSPPQEYSGDYLIGANMTFKKSVLEAINGFPSLFEVRGDESGLFVNLALNTPELKRVFSDKLIAYNHFCNDIGVFIKTHFQDGGRSYHLSYYSKPVHQHLVNIMYRTGSVVLFFVLLLVALFGMTFSLIGLVLLIGFKLVREYKYYFYSFKKCVTEPTFKKLFLFMYLLINPLVFDAGFAYEVLKMPELDKKRLHKAVRPEVIN